MRSNVALNASPGNARSLTAANAVSESETLRLTLTSARGLAFAPAPGRLPPLATDQARIRRGPNVDDRGLLGGVARIGRAADAQAAIGQPDADRLAVAIHLPTLISDDIGTGGDDELEAVAGDSVHCFALSGGCCAAYEYYTTVIKEVNTHLWEF